MKKKRVVVLKRVSGGNQDHARQHEIVEEIVAFFGLDVVETITLNVSGTRVLKTVEYKHLQVVLRRSDIDGLVVPSIDRWFRYKLISDIGVYVKPFEEMSAGSKSAKLLIYCTMSEEKRALDLLKSKDQDDLLEAVRFAHKERMAIALRCEQGKAVGRADPQCCIDPLPNGVEFFPFNKKKQKELIEKSVSKSKIIRGWFDYTDFATNSVKPLFIRFRAGEAIQTLAKELGFPTTQGARHALRNLWWLGYKHRTKTVTKKEWDDDLNRLRHQDIQKHPVQFIVATNLAEKPLIDQELFDAVQNKLAVRKKEYEQRNDLDDLFLAKNLFHCKKCGGLMYPRKGSGGRPSTYTCANRYTATKGNKKGKVKCTEPIYEKNELDGVVGLNAVLYLTNPQFVAEKIKEGLNEEVRADAEAKVATKKRMVVDIEKKRRRVATLVEDSDDPDLSARYKALTGELAAAKNEVLAAQDEVDGMPVFDEEALEAMAEFVTRDMAGFMEKPMPERKALLKKYVTQIRCSVHPVTGALHPEFDVKITVDVEYANPTTEPKPPRVPQGPGRVSLHDSASIRGGKLYILKGNKGAADSTNSATRCSA